MHQFFVSDDQVKKEYVMITGPDVHHIRKVLRMRPGERIRVSTDSGRSFFCEIGEAAEGFVQAEIIDAQAPQTELASHITLFQALPKGNRMETVIEKAVELGVYEIVPIEMKYCVVTLDEKKKAAKRQRWQAQSESAAKQSKRSRIPQVRPVMSFAQALEYAKTLDKFLVPYENKEGMEETRRMLEGIKPGESIGVMIGPEGGFSDEEIAAASEFASVISLGRRILRTDTAAIAVMALLSAVLELQDT